MSENASHPTQRRTIISYVLLGAAEDPAVLLAGCSTAATTPFVDHSRHDPKSQQPRLYGHHSSSLTHNALPRTVTSPAAALLRLRTAGHTIKRRASCRLEHFLPCGGGEWSTSSICGVPLLVVCTEQHSSNK